MAIVIVSIMSKTRWRVSRFIKKASLCAPATTRCSVIGIATFTGVSSGTLTIRTLTSNKAVQNDGVALGDYTAAGVEFEAASQSLFKDVGLKPPVI